MYIIGLGLDFSEFDLWWLLSRRKREKAPTGNVYVFNPENENSDVRESLRMMGYEVDTFGMNISDGNNDEKYAGFYRKSIDKITELVCINRN